MILHLEVWYTLDMMLVLLALEWTVVKRALCRWCRHWSHRHASTTASCRWTAPAGKFQWSLSSGKRRRSWDWPMAQTPQWAKCTGDLAPNTSTWKRKRKTSKFRRMKWKMRETNEECKVRIEERTDNHSRRMTHGWDDAHKHLSQCRVTHHYKCTRKRWRVRCTGYTTGRLQQIAISCKRTYCNK